MKEVPCSSYDNAKMNGVITNGLLKPLTNGVLVNSTVEDDGSNNTPKPGALSNGYKGTFDAAHPQSNGDRAVENTTMKGGALTDRLSALPPEIQHITQGYLPLAKLIHRCVQECWNGLSEVVEKMADISLPTQSETTSAPLPRNPVDGSLAGDRSEANLDKKDRILLFARDQRAVFIKLLVLSQWGTKAADISKVIDLHSWIVGQRTHYTTAANFVGVMKRDLAFAQIPNPDLKTAAEVLSRQKVSAFPDLGYIPQKSLTAKQILKTLRKINNLLSTRLILYEDLPPMMSNFRIHDGRVTFSVAFEFELDLSIADEDPKSQFWFVGFRFTFSPSSTIPDGRLYDDLAGRANEVLKIEGLLGCYDFLHDMTLSYKISVLFGQALQLLRQQWSENLRVELIHRMLVVQYWVNRPAGKSWIEIGIKSGRRKSQGTGIQKSQTFLDVRWLRHNQLVETCDIEIDIHSVSLEKILRQVVALHSSHILESIYNKLAASPIYVDGQLLLELSYSGVDPGECYLQLELSKSKQIRVIIEPVSGSIVVTPTSALSRRIEHDLSRSPTLADEAAQRISFLRCITAEQDLISFTVGAGWDVLRAFRPSPAEVKTLFPTNPTRYVFLRQNDWERGHLLAATHSIGGDQWWLIRPGDLRGDDVSAPLISDPIDSGPLHLEDILCYKYSQRLSRYVSGVMTLQANAQYLNALSIPCVLPTFPRFQKGYRLPVVSFQFQPVKFRRILTKNLTVDWTPDTLRLASVSRSDPGTKHRAWIRETINVSFSDIKPESKKAVVIARGRSVAEPKVLHYLQHQVADDSIRIKPNSGHFSVRFVSSVGQPVVDDLIDFLCQLENLISCLSVIQEHSSMIVKDISLSSVSITYLKGDPELAVLINFPTSSTSSLTLQFSPQDTNPHVRISTELHKYLANPDRSLAANIEMFLPLLSFTLPVLSLFDQLQRNYSTSSTSLSSTTSAMAPQKVRMHILVRSTARYGIQYFDPSSPRLDKMVARFELLPHERRSKLKWVLRPALEERGQQTRSSICSPGLKDMLTKEVFGLGDATDWLALDAGAACDIDKPAPLIRKVDAVVREWVRQAGDGQADGQGDGREDDTPAKAAQPQTKSTPRKNKAGGTTKVTGTVKKPREVITLD